MNENNFTQLCTVDRSLAHFVGFSSKQREMRRYLWMIIMRDGYMNIYEMWRTQSQPLRKQKVRSIFPK